jgi:hypothetical protein
MGAHEMTSRTGPLPLEVRFAVFPGNRLQVNWTSLKEALGRDAACAIWAPTARDSLGLCQQCISLSGQHLMSCSLVHRPRKPSEYFNAVSSTADGRTWQPGMSTDHGEFHEISFEEEGVERTVATTWIEGGSFRAHYRIREAGDAEPRDHYVELDSTGQFVAFGYEEHRPDGSLLACRSQDGLVWVTRDRATRLSETDHVGAVRVWHAAFEEDAFALPQTLLVYAGHWDQSCYQGRSGGFRVPRLGDVGGTWYVWSDLASALVMAVSGYLKGKTISAVPGAVSRPDENHFVKYLGVASGDEVTIPKLVRVRALKHGRRTYLAQYDLADKSRPVYVVAFDSRAYPTGEALYFDANEGGRAFRSLDFGAKWQAVSTDLPVCQAIHP